MAIIGIFFGSDTGNTENIAKMIQKQLGKDVADVHDIAKSSKEDLEAHDILLLGIPTWYYGEAQCDWDDFFPTLEEIDFNGKLVALFGCGDSASYPDSFCDALAEIRDGLEATGCTFVGALDAAEYDGCTSRICRDGKVIGLAVDDGASEAVSDARMEKWIAAVGF